MTSGLSACHPHALVSLQPEWTFLYGSFGGIVEYRVSLGGMLGIMFICGLCRMNMSAMGAPPPPLREGYIWSLEFGFETQGEG